MSHPRLPNGTRVRIKRKSGVVVRSMPSIFPGEEWEYAIDFGDIVAIYGETEIRPIAVPAFVSQTRRVA
ncbi:hypothetical protein Pan216_16840 [Planctomycetes bacterium Pan216]|uniref:Uncharacterized protein n=1 Tax=Kolteria novifilia TaxID=2527975 RepID=A0A518B1K5_9BACT|nr:hypothetical protein Pan216_16840 [Planctomycetes bacterium Pan216]